MIWFFNKNNKVNPLNCKKSFSNQLKVENIVNKNKNVPFQFQRNRRFINFLSGLIILIIFVTIVIVPISYFIYLIF
ncbi:hypothetical protein OC707_01540 ['Opuntia sp.' phytoplasma]|uniref:hypothetical protein n=1 Tax=Candidatus Phytoplasma asiaticum TaxID=2763338 RepID=UPI00271248C8|nr:hypothetical protein ['Opuntia sp.' phytoplasma]MDO8054131.1 hypothetical protein ['Opuntia sp.' phytoplasma]